MLVVTLVVTMVVIVEVSTDEARDGIVQCHGAYVQLSWLRDIYPGKCDVTQWNIAARVYLLYLVGCILFAKQECNTRACDILERFL